MGEDEQAATTNENEQTNTTNEGEQSADDEQSTTAKNTVTIEDSGPCKKKIAIEIPEETIKKAVDEQYNELRRDALVPGFRKGRAPRRLLEKRFGKETTETTISRPWASLTSTTRKLICPKKAPSSSISRSRFVRSSTCPNSRASRSTGQNWKSPTSRSTKTSSKCKDCRVFGRLGRTARWSLTIRLLPRLHSKPRESKTRRISAKSRYM